MIFDTTPDLYEAAIRKSSLERARYRLEVQLRVYYDLMGGDKLTAEDIEQLTRQALLKVDDVYIGYPPLATLATE